MASKPRFVIIFGLARGSALCSCGYNTIRSVDTRSLFSAWSKLNSTLEAMASSSCHVTRYWYLHEHEVQAQSSERVR